MDVPEGLLRCCRLNTEQCAPVIQSQCTTEWRRAIVRARSERGLCIACRWRPLHGAGLCRRLLNLAHVAVVPARHLPIVPGDRDRIPACFGNNAAVSGIASPIDAGALLEKLGFVDCHDRSTHWPWSSGAG